MAVMHAFFLSVPAQTDPKVPTAKNKIKIKSLSLVLSAHLEETDIAKGNFPESQEKPKGK